MNEIRLPAYPLFTFDPMMSLWSMDRTLYGSNTKMWTTSDKPINGNVVVDGIAKRFMGLGGAREVIPQKKIEMDFNSTKYTFGDEKITLEVTFTTPFMPDDLRLTSRPVAYVSVRAKSADGEKHTVKVLFDFSEKLICKRKKICAGGVELLAGGKIGYLAGKKEIPLQYAGDAVNVNWGHIFVAGRLNVVLTSKNSVKGDLNGKKSLRNGGINKVIVAEKEATVDVRNDLAYFFTFAWDGVYAIEYFGEKKPAMWKDFYKNITEAIAAAINDYDEVMKRCMQQNDRRKKEITDALGKDYYTLLVASYRQVIAAHSLVSHQGKPILISKECSSNGCAATVDVTYPSAPLFLCENPDLIRAMLDPVFDFARTKAWKYDFAPHDVGTYPYVMGQVYGSTVRQRVYRFGKRKAPYLCEGENIYRKEGQMPVEESANMIILTAAYFNETGDQEYLEKNFDLLKKWADYLVSQGISLELQLSTDDFGGRLKNNVNLAMKSLIAIATFAKIAEKVSLNVEFYYLNKAKELACDLLEKADAGDRYSLTTGDKDSWSTKYNLVWDKIFGLGLFGDEVYKKESDYYLTKLNKYGLPLDSRQTYAKSDWMIWASVLDDGDKSLRLYSEILVKMLAESTCGLPYPDLYETTATSFPKGGRRHMFARTVQGGMWLPLYAMKVAAENKKNYLL